VSNLDIKLYAVTLRLGVDLNVSVEVFMNVSLRALSYSDLWTLEAKAFFSFYISRTISQ
jgi:hypothetical protein